jgi:type I restriction enzyme S subunit
MAGEWIEEPFPEVIDFQEGPGIMARDFRDEGIPLVRLSGLDRGGSVLSGCNYLDPAMVAGKWAHFALAKGDILLSTSASLGRIAVVGEDAVGAIAYTGIIRMRPRDGRLIAPFIRYLLEGPDFQQQAEMVGVGSVIRHFGPMHLRQMSVKLPPPDEQRAIAHILGTLDDKIELNRRMSETLEAMARALFKSWFVDFDPVRAKSEGRDPGLPQPLADLFPDSFEYSELGEIPRGWVVKALGDLADVVGGSTPKTERAEYWAGGTHHWVTPKDLSGRSMPVLLDTERKITDAGLAQISSGLLPEGTVLLSSRAPIGYLAIAEVPVAVNQGFIAMKARPGTSNLFLLRWANAAHDEIVSHANGSTFLEISKSSFRPIRIVEPSAPVMDAFDRVSRPMYLKLVEHERESRTLAALRDALLPKLISGELPVKDAEKFIGKNT